MKRILFLLLVVSLLSASLMTTAVSAQSECGATYTVKRGDYLSKIAKLCDTSVSALLDANPQISNPSLIYTGQVLKIPTGSQTSPGIGGSVYIVKPGDTLNAIAALFKVSVQDIQKINPAITNPNRIEVGMQIKLPQGAARVRTAGISPISGKAGDTVTLAVTGFRAGIDLEIRFGVSENETELVGTLKTDLRGAILQTVSIPASAQQGKSYLFLVRVRSNPDEKAVTNPFQIGQSSSSNERVYVVERGDTLRKIANKFNTSMAAILAVNPGIKNPNLIYVGQRITIPVNASGPAVTILPAEVPADGKLRVVADKFPANQSVDIRIGIDLNNPALIVDGKTDASGYLSLEVSVPSPAKSGEKWLVRVHTTDLAKTVEATGSFRIK